MKGIVKALTVVVLIAGLVGGVVAAQTFLAPNNAAPSVTLAWNASSGATSYYLYQGGAAGQYTNKVAVGNVTTTTVTTVARGGKYYFAVTAAANGLESPFSNEVSTTVPTPPGAPGGLVVSGTQ